MKKIAIAVMLFSLCFFSACTGNAPAGKPTALETGAKNGYTIPNEKGGADAVETINRTMIAQALGLNENTRSIRFILNTLQVIQAGQLQKAVSSAENGETGLDVVAEDGTNYRIYLSTSGGVEAVKNLDTGEWTIKSAQ